MSISQSTLNYRKENNLCPRCGSMNSPNRSMCENCLKKAAQKTLKKRHKRNKLGLCEICGIPVISNKKFCQYHYDNSLKMISNGNKRRYKERINNNICVDCGKNPCKSSYQRCHECLDKNNCRRKEKIQYRQINNLCTVCGQSSDTRYCLSCREKYNNWIKKSNYKLIMKEKRDAIKQQVFDHYGNKCTHCGIEGFDLLTIDHINEDGASHRKSIKKSGSTFYRWLVNNKFPEGFQVLCWNCNMLKFQKTRDMYQSSV